MRRSAHAIAIIFGFGLITALAGCGGGSGGGGGGGATGRVTGRVAAPAATRAGEAITVLVDGSAVQATVKADGAFTLDRVPAGLHTLVARSLRHAAALVAEVRGGQETNVGEIELRDAGQISGLVTSATTQAPIPGAKVVVTEAVMANTSDVLPHPVRGTRTNGDGSYTLSGMPVGEYVVTIAQHGYSAATLFLTVAAGSTTPGDAILEPAPAQGAGSMTGTVYLVADNGDKSPLAGALVRLARRNEIEPMRPLPLGTNAGAPGVERVFYPDVKDRYRERELYTFSTDDGSYKLDGVPAGDYTAIAVRPGLEAHQQPVTIEADKTATVDFSLRLRQPRVGIVEGVVTDSATRKPIRGAFVHAVLYYPMPLGVAGESRKPGADGAFFITPDDFDLYAETDEQGRYKLRIPAGERVVRADARGYDGADVTVTVSAGSVVTGNIALAPRVIREVALRGRVLTRDGDVEKPVEGAIVSATSLDSGGGIAGGTGDNRMHPSNDLRVETNAAGEYSIRLETGTYYVYAHKGNRFAEPAQIDLQENTQRDFVLKEGIDPPVPPASGNR